MDNIFRRLLLAFCTICTVILIFIIVVITCYFFDYYIDNKIKPVVENYINKD